MEKGEHILYPKDPLVAKFLELYEELEVWDTSDNRLPLIHDIYEKIEAKKPEKELRELIETTAKKILFGIKGTTNSDERISILAILLVGEMQATDCAERLIEKYNNALANGSEYIPHYSDNWIHDEFASIRTSCIRALSKIDDPRGYSTIYSASFEEHLHVAGDASGEVTYDRFKYVMRNQSIYDLKREKYPLNWHNEPMFVGYINKLLAERGHEIQSEEHRLAEEMVYTNDQNEDEHWVTGRISGLYEELMKFDWKEFLKHLVQELNIHQAERNFVNHTPAYAFLFKLLGTELVEEELTLLLKEYCDSNSKTNIEYLLHILSDTEQNEELDKMSRIHKKE